MTTAHRTTLAALRRQLRILPQGCPTCRYWFGYPIICFDGDGTENGRSEYPICPDCGREIPQGREHHLIGVSFDRVFKPMIAPGDGQ